MMSQVNRLRGKLFCAGAMILLALSLSRGQVLAGEPETPPSPPLPPPQARTNERLAIRAGRLFDGKSDDLKKQQVILIEGTRIVQVGPANDVHIPAGTEVLDLTSATVWPGVINGHTHVSTTPPPLNHTLVSAPFPP